MADVLTQASAHYDSEYFAWQNPIGEFGGWANRMKFAQFIKKTDRVLDFGCGGGWLVSGFDCAERCGVEVNPTARAHAAKLTDRVFASSDELPAGYFDVVISNNALEHTLRPLDEVKSLFRTLKPGGRIVIVAPCESIYWRYKPGDINHHPYGWSPMALGNLLDEAGFKVSESRAYWAKWPPRYRTIAKMGPQVFRAACYIWGHVSRQWFQVRAVAAKPQ